MKENVLEWIKNEDTVACTISQRRLITKIKALANKYPDEVIIDCINEDGSIFCHIPRSYIHIKRPAVVSDKRKEDAKNRMKDMWNRKRGKQNV